MLFFLITREQQDTESGLDVVRDGGLLILKDGG